MHLHRTTFFLQTFVSPSFTIDEAGTSLNLDGGMKVCLFNFCLLLTYMYTLTLIQLICHYKQLKRAVTPLTF